MTGTTALVHENRYYHVGIRIVDHQPAAQHSPASVAEQPATQKPVTANSQPRSAIQASRTKAVLLEWVSAPGADTAGAIVVASSAAEKDRVESDGRLYRATPRPGIKAPPFTASIPSAYMSDQTPTYGEIPRKLSTGSPARDDADADA